MIAGEKIPRTNRNGMKTTREGMCRIFIPSYHRPSNIKTAWYMKKIGWDMGRITVFVDNEADDISEYEKTAAEMGFNLHVFDMEEARRRYDYVHRASKSRRSAGQARNMFQDYALKNGIDFYCVMDDDTNYFATFMQRRTVKEYDLVRRSFVAMEELMRKRRIGVMAFSQTGDFIGGYKKQLFTRKVMNTTFYLLPYIYRGERGVQDDDTSLFSGIINEGLFTGTMNHGIVLHQERSATQAGGLTDLYNECKLLNKALVTVIQFPSAIRAEYQEKNGGRIHHRINYRYLGPVIIKGSRDRDNISWDKWEEDYPFTNENKIYKHKED